MLSGEEFHRDYFSKLLPSWLGEAFSHPFWDRMMSGKGSARLYTGWLFELYHYTRNANRHMPLSCALHRLEGDQGPAREALRGGVEPLPLLREVAEGARLHRRGDRAHVGAAADDARAVELHAPGRARGRARVLDLLGGARGHHDRSRHVQPVLREGRASSTASRRARSQPIFAHLDLDVKYGTPICSSRSCSTVDTMSAERAVARARATATSWSSTSGCGPRTSSATTKSKPTRCRAGRSIRSGTDASTEGRCHHGDHATAPQRTAKVSDAADQVAIEYLSQRDRARRRGRAAVPQDAAAPRRQDAASTGSPSGSRSRRRASPRSPKQLKATGRARASRTTRRADDDRRRVLRDPSQVLHDTGCSRSTSTRCGRS